MCCTECAFSTCRFPVILSALQPQRDFTAMPRYEKRVYIRLMVWILLAGMFSLQCAQQDGKGAHTNIIFILIDTVRPDHLSCYGYARPTSPTIDVLAHQGVLFRNVIAQAPWTKPSVASFFTSRLPFTHGVTWRGENERLPESLVTLAEVLSRNGYRTAAFSDNPHITKSNGFGQGFDTFIENHSFLKGNAESLTDKVIAWLDKNYQKKHFIYIHYLDPHDPYEAPGSYHEMFLEQKPVRVRKSVRDGNAYVLNGEFSLDIRMEKTGKNIPAEEYPIAVPIDVSPEELQYLVG